METQKRIGIIIPEGKMPKFRETPKEVFIEWVDKGKKWEEYVEDYRQHLNLYYRALLERSAQEWPKMFKFGLLQHIANALNEKEIDWEDKTQDKCKLCYNYNTSAINLDNHRYTKGATVYFTEKAAHEAVNIIPATFLETF